MVPACFGSASLSSLSCEASEAEPSSQVRVDENIDGQKCARGVSPALAHRIIVCCSSPSSHPHAPPTHQRAPVPAAPLSLCSADLQQQLDALDGRGDRLADSCGSSAQQEIFHHVGLGGRLLGGDGGRGGHLSGQAHAAMASAAGISVLSRHVHCFLIVRFPLSLAKRRKSKFSSDKHPAGLWLLPSPALAVASVRVSCEGA